MYDDRSSDRHARHSPAASDQPRRPVALNEAARVGELLDHERFERRVEAALHAGEPGRDGSSVSVVALRLLAEGEPAADEELLQGCAARLALALRAADAIGRGDDRALLVLMHDADGAGADEAAARMRLAIESRPLRAAAGRVTVRVELGVATRGEGAATSAEELIAAARQV